MMDEFSKCFLVGSICGLKPFRHFCWSAHPVPREGGFFYWGDGDDNDVCDDDGDIIE